MLHLFQNFEFPVLIFFILQHFLQRHSLPISYIFAEVYHSERAFPSYSFDLVLVIENLRASIAAGVAIFISVGWSVFSVRLSF